MKDYFFLFSVIKIITISIENTVVQVRKVDKKILSEITTKRNSDKDYLLLLSAIFVA